MLPSISQAIKTYSASVKLFFNRKIRKNRPSPNDPTSNHTNSKVYTPIVPPVTQEAPIPPYYRKKYCICKKSLPVTVSTYNMVQPDKARIPATRGETLGQALHIQHKIDTKPLPPTPLQIVKTRTLEETAFDIPVYPPTPPTSPKYATRISERDPPLVRLALAPIPTKSGERSGASGGAKANNQPASVAKVDRTSRVIENLAKRGSWYVD
ncbi:hypothetical protein TWF694_011793 [Orbilia ellipsospora]|uniref:Uncharacterized protein n=1 Tax=Orbilia ellipsospora TaxID=2528407 RepID=A0AAV9X6N3_9PEZI